MPSEVILPRVDMDMATGRISKWLVEAGSRVAKGQPLFEIETDKAAMEIEAPAAGTLQTIVAASGADIPVGSVVGWIFAEGEAESVATSGQAEPIVPAPPAEAQVLADGPPRIAAVSADQAPRATPLARRLARDGGIDLRGVTGSGPRGRIQAADLGTIAQAQAKPVVTALGGSALNIVQLRQGEGAPLILLHGWGADAHSWRPFLSGQPQARPAYAVDLPGHGASPLGAITSFADLVDAVKAALAAASLGPAHLVGHSLGAAVAAAVAARGRLDVRSLLLLAPAGLGPAINGAFLRGFVAARSEASLTPWMHELVADPAAMTPAFVRATLKARQGTTLADTQRRVAEAVFPDDTQAFSIRPDLATLSLPTRVVLGSADRILPAAQAGGLPGLVAIHRLAGVGHMPQWEARDTVATILGQMTGP